MGTRAGTSFSPRRCSLFGLSARSTFAELLELDFALVRVSAYWDEIRGAGYGELDWLIERAESAGRSVVLTVGMKGIQWPEFYLPADVKPDPDARGRIGADPSFAAQAVEFVSATVERYRDTPALAAWQVENEPFNRSGPQRWWIDPRLVRREMEAVRALDSRPIVVNAFNHFDSALDAASRPRHGPLGLRRLVPEQAILDVLGPSDILGLDVYRSIGTQSADADWSEAARRWLGEAERRGRAAWVIESQAEPWEPAHDTLAQPISFDPDGVGAVYAALVNAGFSTILLWGCEYWFWRAKAGDRRWLDAARRTIEQE